ncbi:MAG: hypothetical protein H6Q89_569 [Myxococcaceae bacterium]|nr:hypothetical protein [Myxococcaceae bacterium]
MDPNAPVKQQRSPLFYVAIGCGGLMALILVGFAVAGLLLVRAGKGLVEGMTDPKQKAANVQKMLGTAPAGYYPVVTMSVPLFMDMALLGDKEPLEDGGFADFDKGFMYFRIIANEQSNKAKDFFDGKDSDTSALKGSGVNVDAKDILRRGALKTSNGTNVKYVATRGTMDTQGQRREEQKSGLNTVMYFECPGDTAVRMGVWMMRDLDPSLPTDQLKLEGTVADEAEIVGFIQPLTPCGK